MQFIIHKYSFFLDIQDMQFNIFPYLIHILIEVLKD